MGKRWFFCAYKEDDPFRSRKEREDFARTAVEMDFCNLGFDFSEDCLGKPIMLLEPGHGQALNHTEKKHSAIWIATILGSGRNAQFYKDFLLFAQDGPNQRIIERFCEKAE